MQFSAAQIALLVQGKVEGDPQVTVHSFGKIEEAVAGQLSFLANPKYEQYLYTTGASVILLNEQLPLQQKVDATLIRVPDAYSAFATLLAKYQEMTTAALEGIQQPSYISSSAQLGTGVYVGAFAHIGDNVQLGNQVKIFPGVCIGNNVIIGNQVLIHPGVVIYHDCIIGNNVTIHSGTVIGSDGFGFAPQSDGTLSKVPQIGNVVIEDGVEIGANTTIDRATIGSTRIGKGVKLDNLIQIAHNVEVGENTVIAAQTGLSGSIKVGKQVMIGGQVGSVGHIQIADNTKIGAKAGITKSLTQSNKTYTGFPAVEFSTDMRRQAQIKQLPELQKRVAELEKQVQELLNKGTKP
ncbi:MAG: UDP-3-O-(3-hydroxymyristoyl)glucosamine N-acyltransferase [Sediminibacterium sp.]